MRRHGTNLLMLIIEYRRTSIIIQIDIDWNFRKQITIFKIFQNDMKERERLPCDPKWSSPLQSFVKEWIQKK